MRRIPTFLSISECTTNLVVSTGRWTASHSTEGHTHVPAIKEHLSLWRCFTNYIGAHCSKRWQVWWTKGLKLSGSHFSSSVATIELLVEEYADLVSSNGISKPSQYYGWEEMNTIYTISKWEYIIDLTAVHQNKQEGEESKEYISLRLYTSLG